MQSKKHSIYEVLINQFIGQVVSVLFCLFVLKVGLFASIGTTLFFLFASLIRSYFVRRFFNRFEE